MDMSKYISYQELPSLMGLEKGDIVLLSSDITDLYIQCKKNGEKLDLNILLDKFQEAIGEEGTLLIPTYNWIFCEGRTFDYKKTPSKTGVIGDAALKRKDFKRTKHPIYSFAVWQVIISAYFLLFSVFLQLPKKNSAALLPVSPPMTL